MLKGDIVKWHSWKRWWIAQLLSQDMAFCKEWRKTSRGSRGPGAGKKIGKIFCPFFAFFSYHRPEPDPTLSCVDLIEVGRLIPSGTGEDEIREFKHILVLNPSRGPEHEDQEALGARDFKS